MSACLHALVEGRVQGVFFRASAREEALSLGLKGWARNLRDGRVEVLATGEADAVSAFHEWLKEGPPDARVDAVHVDWPDDPGEVSEGFRIR